MAERTRKMADCHPNRPHKAKGLCSACYLRSRDDKRLAEKRGDTTRINVSEVKEVVDVPQMIVTAPKGGAVRAAKINYRDPKVAGYVAGKLVKNMLDTKKTVEELVPEGTPAQKAETAEAIDSNPQVQEAVRQRLEIDGLGDDSRKEFVLMMWSWLRGADAGKAKEAAKLLGKYFIGASADKGKPTELPIAGIKEGLDKMLGDANPLAKQAKRQVEAALEGEAN